MKNNYIVIGDSITYGIGDYENGGWSAMLKKYIVNQDDTKICNNFVQVVGFPGATSKDILNKIDSVLDTFKHDEFNNIVMLSIGVNDTQNFNGNYKVSIDSYKSNIEYIIKKIKDREFKIIVLGLTRIGINERLEFKPNKYYDNTVIEEYDSELKKICDESIINYIPMQDVLQKDDFVDGLHPNSKGHKKIFERVVGYVEC